MDSKSKTFIAVFAVAIMVCGCLAPLMYSEGNMPAEEKTADESADLSVLALIEKLKNGITDLEDIDLGNGIKLIPVGEKTYGGDVPALDSTINGKVTIADKVTMTIASETTFKSQNDVRGHIEVEKGGTLVLFEPTKSSSYKFIDGNTPTSTDFFGVIQMWAGSHLNIFGYDFEFVAGVTESFDLLSMGSVGDGGERSCTMVFNPNASNDENTFAIFVGYSKIMIAESFGMYYNMFKEEIKIGEKTIPKDHPDLWFKGKFTKEDTKVTLNGMAFVDMRTASDLVTGYFKVVNSYFQLSTTEVTESEVKVDGKMCVNLSDIYVSVDNVIPGETLKDWKTTPSSIVYNGAFNTNEITFNISIKETDNPMSIVVSFNATREQDLALTADRVIDFDYFTKEEAGFDYALTTYAEKLVLKIQKTTMAFNLTVNEQGVGLTSTFTSGISLNVDTMGTVTITKDDMEFSPLNSDIAIIIPSIAVNVTDEKNGTVTFGNITVAAKLGKGYIASQQEFVFAMNITEPKVEIKNGEVSLTGNLTIAMNIENDFLQRQFLLVATGIYAEPEDDGIGMLKIAKLSTKNDFNLDILDDKKLPIISAIAAMMGVGNAQGGFEIVNFQLREEIMTADSVELTLRNGLKYKELCIRHTGELTIQTIEEYTFDKGMYKVVLGYVIDGGEVVGSITDIKGSEELFTIENDAKTGFTVTAEINLLTDPVIYSSFDIYNGYADFDGGKFPFGITVRNNATFKAQGMMAPFFAFENESKKYGYVVLDTDAYSLKNVKNVIGDGDYIYAASTDGYRLAFNLSDLSTGTIVANEGNELPSVWANKTGFNMTSADGKTGKFTSDGGFTNIDVECKKKIFTLSYFGDIEDSQRYAFGSKVTITDKVPVLPSAEAEFLGWTDGSGKMYSSGDTYVMPAHNVTMMPVFTKTVTPVKEGDNLYADASDSMVVKVDMSNVHTDWKTITIKSTFGTVTFDRTTYYKMCNPDGGLHKNKDIYLRVSDINSLADKDIREMTDGMSVYAIRVGVIGTDGLEKNYTASTVFDVTLNVRIDGPVSDFKAYCINDYGVIEEVKVDKFVKNADGTYNVMFKTNHFSVYAIEPVYSEEDYTILYTCIGIAVALVAIIGIAMTFYVRKDKH